MTTASPLYGTKVTMTWTLSSLASDTNLVAGRESTAVDNKDVDDSVEIMVGGLFTTGTTPTTARQIEVWAYGSYDDTNFSANATGADATLTPDEKSLMKLLTVIPTNGTSDRAYKWGPFAVGAAFGGIVPVRWGLYVVHNTGVALNTTAANHEAEYFPVKFESA